MDMLLYHVLIKAISEQYYTALQESRCRRKAWEQKGSGNLLDNETAPPVPQPLRDPQVDTWRLQRALRRLQVTLQPQRRMHAWTHGCMLVVYLHAWEANHVH